MYGYPGTTGRYQLVRGEEGIVPVDTSGALIMSRCINWPPQHGQKTRNNFLADHFLFFFGIGEIRYPKDAKNGLLERWRALFRSPSATLGRIIKQAISPFFAVRSLLLHCTARETDGGITDRVIDAFAPFEGLALRHIEDDRSSCSIGVLAAFEASVTMAPQGGRWRSKKALSSAPKAHFWPLLGT